jgi:hypothetical protein
MSGDRIIKELTNVFEVGVIVAHLNAQRALARGWDEVGGSQADALKILCVKTEAFCCRRGKEDGIIQTVGQLSDSSRDITPQVSDANIRSHGLDL